MSCNCRQKIDELLKPKGLRLRDKNVCVRVINGIATCAYTIQTEKIIKSKNGKTPDIFMTHCPFCGKEYNPESDNETEANHA